MSDVTERRIENAITKGMEKQRKATEKNELADIASAEFDSRSVTIKLKNGREIRVYSKDDRLNLSVSGHEKLSEVKRTSATNVEVVY